MAATTIEYCDEVSNPLFARPKGDESVKIGTFCEKPDTEGTCKSCWAETLNLRFGNKLKFDKSNRDKIEWIYKEKPMQRLRTLNTDKRESGRNPGNPLMVFCCDTFDIFQPSISDELRHRIFDEYDKFSNLTLQIQTTYPAKMNRFLRGRYDLTGIPSHYWFGMSAGTQSFFDLNIHYLQSLQCSVKYVVFEPLLEEINGRFYAGFIGDYGGRYDKFDNFWLVVGGESGTNARQCSVEWIRSLVEQAEKAGLPILVKQYGTYLSKILGFKSSKGKEISEWSDDTKIREFPV